MERVSVTTAWGCAQHGYTFCPSCSGLPVGEPTIRFFINGEPAPAPSAPDYLLIDRVRFERLEQLVGELVQELRER